MPATLSPFRYIQVARYLMQWWLDTAPGLAARRKAAQERAARIMYAPRLRGRAMAAAAATAQVSEDVETPRARRAARHLGVDVVDKPSATPDDAGVLLPRPDAHPNLHFPSENTEIYRLMNDDRAYMEGSMKAPREIIVLCHGEYGIWGRPRRHGRAMELPSPPLETWVRAQLTPQVCTDSPQPLPSPSSPRSSFTTGRPSSRSSVTAWAPKWSSSVSKGTWFRTFEHMFRAWFVVLT